MNRTKFPLLPSPDAMLLIPSEEELPLTVLPEQFYGERRLPRKGILGLHTAVLMEAVSNLAHLGISGRIEQQERGREALTWIRSEDERWPFSFVRVCFALDLDPAFLRRRLLLVYAPTLIFGPAPINSSRITGWRRRVRRHYELLIRDRRTEQGTANGQYFVLVCCPLGKFRILADYASPREAICVGTRLYEALWKHAKAQQAKKKEPSADLRALLAQFDPYDTSAPLDILTPPMEPPCAPAAHTTPTTWEWGWTAMSTCPPEAVAP